MTLAGGRRRGGSGRTGSAPGGRVSQAPGGTSLHAAGSTSGSQRQAASAQGARSSALTCGRAPSGTPARPVADASHPCGCRMPEASLWSHRRVSLGAPAGAALWREQVSAAPCRLRDQWRASSWPSAPLTRTSTCSSHWYGTTSRLPLQLGADPHYVVRSFSQPTVQSLHRPAQLNRWVETG